MKRIKNDSHQGFSIFLNTDKGCKEVYLKPGESIVVPSYFVSEQVETLHKRRIFKISNA